MGKGLSGASGPGGTPPAGDRANAVIQGAFAAIGPGLPFTFLGPFNLLIWAALNTALTTAAGSLNATVASGTGIAVGQAINSVNLPPGATVKTVAGANISLALAPLVYGGIVTTNSPNVALPGLANTAGLLGAAVSGTGIAAGVTVIGTALNGVALSAIPTIASNPDGTTTPLTFAPTGNAITATGADANALFTGSGIVYNATVQVERSFDGGNTWLLCNVGGTGTLAQYAAGTPVSIVVGEPEGNVAYRLNCTAYTGIANTTLNYRLSAMGAMAMSIGLSPAI